MSDLQTFLGIRIEGSHIVELSSGYTKRFRVTGGRLVVSQRRNVLLNILVAPGAFALAADIVEGEVSLVGDGFDSRIPPGGLSLVVLAASAKFAPTSRGTMVLEPDAPATVAAPDGITNHLVNPGSLVVSSGGAKVTGLPIPLLKDQRTFSTASVACSTPVDIGISMIAPCRAVPTLALTASEASLAGVASGRTESGAIRLESAVAALVNYDASSNTVVVENVRAQSVSFSHDTGLEALGLCGVDIVSATGHPGESASDVTLRFDADRALASDQANQVTGDALVPTGDSTLRFITLSALRQFYSGLACLDDQPHGLHSLRLTTSSDTVTHVSREFSTVDGIVEPPLLCAAIGLASGVAASAFVGHLLSWEAAVLAAGILAGVHAGALVVPAMFFVYAVSRSLFAGTGMVAGSVADFGASSVCELMIGTPLPHRRAISAADGGGVVEHVPPPAFDVNAFPVELSPPAAPLSQTDEYRRRTSLVSAAGGAVGVAVPTSVEQDAIDTRLFRLNTTLARRAWLASQEVHGESHNRSLREATEALETRLRSDNARNHSLSSEVVSDYNTMVDAAITSMHSSFDSHRSQMASRADMAQAFSGIPLESHPVSDYLGSIKGDCYTQRCPDGAYYSPDNRTFFIVVD